MKSPGGGSAIADAGRTDHAGLAAHASGHESSGHRRDHRTEMADHRIIALPGTAPMDVAVAAPHGAKLRTQIGAQGIQCGVAEGHTSRLVADEWRKNVTLV